MHKDKDKDKDKDKAKKVVIPAQAGIYSKRALRTQCRCNKPPASVGCQLPEASPREEATSFLRRQEPTQSKHKLKVDVNSVII